MSGCRDRIASPTDAGRLDVQTASGDRAKAL